MVIMGTYYETASSNIYFPIIVESFRFESFFIGYFPHHFPHFTWYNGPMCSMIIISLYHHISTMIITSKMVSMFFFMSMIQCVHEISWNIMIFPWSWYIYIYISKNVAKIVSMISIHGDHDIFPSHFLHDFAPPIARGAGRRAGGWAAEQKGQGFQQGGRWSRRR